MRMRPWTSRTLSRTISECSKSPVTSPPTSSSLTLRTWTSRDRTSWTDVCTTHRRPTRTSRLHARQDSGASLCHAATTASTCLSLLTQWLRRLFRLPTQVSRTSGHSRTASRLFMSLDLRSSARSIFPVSALARPCQWTSPSRTLVLTSSALCSRPHRTRTAHGV